MQGVDFQGFAGDCTITGRITMFGERLTDFLNGQERFRLSKVRFQSLDDGHEVEVDSVSVERSDLLVVVGTGPRGSDKERVRLQQSRMELSIGPYVVLGRLHVRPGLDPMQSVLQREPMIPFTDATIAYSVAGQLQVADIGTVIVNRLQVEWITGASEHESLFPDAVVKSPYAMRLTRS